jgi:hypothetical protein
MKRTVRRRKQLIACVSVPTVLIGAIGGSAAIGRGNESERASIPLADASVIVEVNATDGDAGLQVFVDAEAWKEIQVFSPTGRKVLDVQTRGRLRNHGLTELFSESSEPPFDEFPLRKFKRLFPEGKYRIRGTTIEGDRIAGGAKLTHDIPDGPEITMPEDGDVVPANAAVAQWTSVTGTGGINIVGYRVIVEREDPLRVFSVDLPRTADSMTIPPEFLKPGIEYKLEVAAIERSGNQTLTEISFTVE